jgi:hypothetical protein
MLYVTFQRLREWGHRRRGARLPHAVSGSAE